MVIVECDENAHDGYPVSYELTRMEQIHEALLKSGICTPVVFIRYNPNGPVTVDDQKKKIPIKKREEILIKMLKDIQGERITIQSKCCIALTSNFHMSV